MAWDLGFGGLLLLVAMSAGFGVVALALTWRSTTHWVGPIAAATYFVAGLWISEAWFGWATEEDLQPNIDGLSFDETLLLALIPGVAAVLVTRHVSKRRRRAEAVAPATSATEPKHRAGTPQ